MKKPKTKLRLLWIVDPWETLDHENDTTLRLAEEAMLAGAECYLAENRSISLKDGKAVARIQRILKIDRPRTAANLLLSGKKTQELAGFDHFFYRTDPPVDLSYLLPLQILASIERKGALSRIHSPASTLFQLNEKWAPVELGSLFPPSLVSASPDLLLDFLKAEKKAVIKPLYQAQSKGVGVLEYSIPREAELRKKLEAATEDAKLPVILQRYLPGIKKGETRLWFVEGKLIASVKKIPKSGESIIDMDHGGRLDTVVLKAAEKAAAKKIGAFLKKHGILWAAVDLIDGKITDFNHTSPGLIVAMEKLLGKNLARLALRPILGSFS